MSSPDGEVKSSGSSQERGGRRDGGESAGSRQRDSSLSGSQPVPLSQGSQPLSTAHTSHDGTSKTSSNSLLRMSHVDPSPGCEADRSHSVSFSLPSSVEGSLPTSSTPLEGDQRVLSSSLTGVAVGYGGEGEGGKREEGGGVRGGGGGRGGEEEKGVSEGGGGEEGRERVEGGSEQEVEEETVAMEHSVELLEGSEDMDATMGETPVEGEEEGSNEGGEQPMESTNSSKTTSSSSSTSWRLALSSSSVSKPPSLTPEHLPVSSGPQAGSEQLPDSQPDSERPLVIDLTEVQSSGVMEVTEVTEVTGAANGSLAHTVDRVVAAGDEGGGEEGGGGRGRGQEEEAREDRGGEGGEANEPSRDRTIMEHAPSSPHFVLSPPSPFRGDLDHQVTDIEPEPMDISSQTSFSLHLSQTQGEATPSSSLLCREELLQETVEQEGEGEAGIEGRRKEISRQTEDEEICRRDGDTLALEGTQTGRGGKEGGEEGGCPVQINSMGFTVRQEATTPATSEGAGHLFSTLHPSMTHSHPPLSQPPANPSSPSTSVLRPVPVYESVPLDSSSHSSPLPPESTSSPSTSTSSHPPPSTSSLPPPSTSTSHPPLSTSSHPPPSTSSHPPPSTSPSAPHPDPSSNSMDTSQPSSAGIWNNLQHVHVHVHLIITAEVNTCS